MEKVFEYELHMKQHQQEQIMHTLMWKNMLAATRKLC